MQLYELIYLIKPELSEEAVRDFSQRVNSLIQEQGGILERTENPGKRGLSYPFKKEGKYVKSAFLCSLSFYLEAQKLIALKQTLQKEKDILRLSFFKKESKKVSTEVPKRKKLRQKRKPRKVELKEIEDKIEELIGE